MHIDHFKVEEGAKVYVPARICYHEYFLAKDEYEESGFRLETNVEHLKGYTRSWPKNWKDFVGEEFFLTEESAKEFVQKQIDSITSTIMNLSKKDLFDELYSGWMESDDGISYIGAKAMQDRLEQEFGVRPEHFHYPNRKY